MVTDRMTKIRFAKMHGIGNDFVVVDDRCERFRSSYAELAKRICDRHEGVGGNGLIVVQEGAEKKFLMRLFNPDGSEAEACGNGLRCLAKYLYDSGDEAATSARIETVVGVFEVTLLKNEAEEAQVMVDMGTYKTREPRYFRCEGTSQSNHRICVGGNELAFHFVYLSSPHAVFFGDFDMRSLLELGGDICQHRYFPRGTNVHFANVVSQKRIRILTWERGDGVTLGCGTGSCAAAIAGHLSGKTAESVDVHNRGGDLFIEIVPDENRVFMTGPATNVCEGVFLWAHLKRAIGGGTTV